MNRKLPRRGTFRPRGSLAALAAGILRPSGRLAAFEREAAASFAVRHAVCTGSGRLALALLLRALGLRAGDEVLLPALTFHAVPSTVERLGFRPVFVDVDPRTALIDPREVARCAGPRTRAVLATHLFGLPCPMAELQAVCDQREVALLEDLAQAAGARAGGRPLGSLGRAGFTSLETVKLLPAYGGGLLLTSDDGLAARLRQEASTLEPPDRGRLARKIAMGHLEAALGHPPLFTLAWPLFDREADTETWVGRYKRRKQGAGNHDAALSPAQAAAGQLALRSLEAHVAARRRNADRLHEHLAGCWFPAVEPAAEPGWYQVVVRVRDAQECVAAGRAAGIDVGRDVATDLSGGACPVAAELADELVQLPSHPPLDDADLRRVADTVRPWLR